LDATAYNKIIRIVEVHPEYILTVDAESIKFMISASRDLYCPALNCLIWIVLLELGGWVRN
jgi:hypothetical protein